MPPPPRHQARYSHEGFGLLPQKKRNAELKRLNKAVRAAETAVVRERLEAQKKAAEDELAKLGDLAQGRPRQLRSRRERRECRGNELRLLHGHFGDLFGKARKPPRRSAPVAIGITLGEYDAERERVAEAEPTHRLSGSDRVQDAAAFECALELMPQDPCDVTNACSQEKGPGGEANAMRLRAATRPAAAAK